MPGQTQLTAVNPFSLLLCDTDALIQIFCSSQESLLRRLKIDFDIDCAVVEAVEAEMMRPRRPRAECCQPGFQKAIENGSLLIIDRTSLPRFTRNDPSATYDSIQLRGQQYALRIGRGEAYTHAAASVLNAAVLSNDGAALRRGDQAGLALGNPTIRSYDIFTFFFQRQFLSAKDCDSIRKSLVECGDGPHESFANKKYVEGLPSFYPRLLDGGCASLGSDYPREFGDEKRVTIFAIKR